MPIVTHIVKYIFAYPCEFRVWTKLPQTLSVSQWTKLFQDACKACKTCKTCKCK